MELSKLSIRLFFRNFYNLFKYDFHHAEDERRRQWEELRDYATVGSMFRYFNESNAGLYKEELEYVRKHGLKSFPYERIRQLNRVECGYDDSLGMAFALHNGKRLYFPEDMTVEIVEWYYRYLIEGECLLGGHYTGKMPHCYQSERVKVNHGDVYVDVGAAEGLVALDVIDRASKVFIVEPDQRWLKALYATFKPFGEKCVIVPKFMTDHNGRDGVTLEYLLKNETSCPIFVKMDIEGFEKMVLKASGGFLANQDQIKLACCTYHYDNDAQALADFFSQLGYQWEFSDGWMLFSDYDTSLLKPPFFRHGLIRAWK